MKNKYAITKIFACNRFPGTKTPKAIQRSPRPSAHREARWFAMVMFGVLLPFGLLTRLPAQEARFFRVAGPVPATITETTPAGFITWTNLPADGTFTVQTATLLEGGGDWVDWTQAAATNPASTLMVFSSNSPSGMALIPAGSFTMGDTFDDGWSGELPLHTVYLSAFYLDKYEVTKALWEEVVAWNGGNGYVYEPGSGLGKATNHPVHTVSWYDVVKWCNARSQKEGLVPCYYTDAGLTSIYKTNRVAPYVNWTANGYRLPTEAEWEKAARGGSGGHRFPWSDTDNITHSRANYAAGHSSPYNLSYPTNYHPTFATNGLPYTSPVAYFAPNGYGLHDMAGNLAEWCWDWYGLYSSESQTDPHGPMSESDRVLRGGAWHGDSIISGAFFSRVANRVFCTLTSRNYYIGFRCARVAGQ